MTKLEDFKHEEIHTHTLLHVMPAEYTKKEETHIFQALLIKAWKKFRKEIPVEFRSSVRETYQINGDIMTVILIYNPLI